MSVFLWEIQAIFTAFHMIKINATESETKNKTKFILEIKDEWTIVVPSLDQLCFIINIFFNLLMTALD